MLLKAMELEENQEGDEQRERAEAERATDQALGHFSAMSLRHKRGSGKGGQEGTASGAEGNEVCMS